ncbi:MAG TPA: hypothetical protein VJT75_05230, partial [Thermoleophilaceae bacterium]|nr:hypothetical protein [Thermoleophilaceae bacterium]
AGGTLASGLLGAAAGELLLLLALGLLGRRALRDTRLLLGDSWTNFLTRIAPRRPAGMDPPDGVPSAIAPR